MKITDIKTFIVGNPWKNWLFVKVYTDEDITGLGEATRGLTTKPVEGDVGKWQLTEFRVRLLNETIENRLDLTELNSLLTSVPLQIEA